MAEEYWDAERVGRELNPDQPLHPSSVRKAMARARISAVHGYPASEVMQYRARRPGRGHRSDLEDKPVEKLTDEERHRRVRALRSKYLRLLDEMANAPQPKAEALNHRRAEIAGKLRALGVDPGTVS